LTETNYSAVATSQTINTSGILFRMAVQSAKRSEMKGLGRHTYPDESRYREADEFIVTVMMTHAAIEAAWHWEFMINYLEKMRWPVDFFNGNGYRALCEKRQRAVMAPGGDVKKAVAELSAWRNFLQHGDLKSRDKLTEYIGTEDFHPLMNHMQARHMLSLGDIYFGDFSKVTGAQLIGPSISLWPGWD
jgi:hypothetical protein